MKKSVYLALLFVGISITSLLAAGVTTIPTAGHSDLSSTPKQAVSTVSPNVDEVTGGVSLVTLPVTGTLCSGSALVVDFTSSGTFYGIANVFTVELSDATGSFASPVIISTAPLSLVGLIEGGQIYAQIPNGTPFGTGYRIRVVASDPAANGTDNGTDIIIKNEVAPSIPTVSINGPTDFCYGSATTFLTSSTAQNNLWFPGGVNTNPFIGVVAGGCYYTQITGSNGCATSSYPVCITVNTPIFTFLGYFENNALVTTSDTTVTICEGDSAQLGLIIEGGVPPYDIFYTPDGLDVITVNDVGVPFNPESYVYTFYVSQPGFYQTIGITDNFATNCGSNGNSGLVSIQTTPPPVTAFSYNPFCGPLSQLPVGAPGFLIGGTYTFDVAPVDGATIDSQSGIISNATIGNTYIIRYTVEGNFCQASSTTSITVSPTDVVSFTIASFCSNSPSPAPVGAPGFATGGTYSFQTAPLDGAVIDASTGIITNASDNATYTVVYTSPAGTCQNTASTTVTTKPSPVVSGTVTNTLCNQSLGSIHASVTGGVEPYTYSWSNSETSEDISNLSANSYTLTVTDDEGCTDDSTFSITNTNEPELNLAVSNTTCGNTNGAIDLTVTEGTGPFEFVWTPSDLETEDITGLTAGSYSVQVTDNGTTCVVTGEATIINEDAPTVTFTSENSLCAQSVGSIDVTVSLNGGSASITHNWSNGFTTEDLTGLAAGTYVDTVTDGNGCEVIISATITNSNQFTASSTVTNPTCASPNGGSIDVTINGGVEPYIYVWSPNSSSTTQDVNNLSSGSYSVEITDAASCSTSVTSTIAPLNTITLSSTQVNATCGNTDGSIDLTVTGGSGTYDYEWSNGETTQDIASLDTGSYAVTVRDLVDTTCTATINVSIIYGNLPVLSFQTTPVSCTTDNGTINLTITNGSGDYNFSWTGPDSFTASTEDLSDLAAGDYSVTVNDVTTTCVVEGSVTVAPVNPPVLSAIVVNTTCGNNNGIIDVTVTGGSVPFTIDWSNLAITLDQINLSAGDYTLTLTDANGCVDSETYTINPSVQPTSTLVIVQPTCSNDTGSVTVELTNATEPIIYSWTKDNAPFASFANLTDLGPGLYILSATDGNGCLISDTATLAYPNLPVVSVTVVNTQCGLETGSIDLTVTGGTPDYTFAWDDSFGFTATTEDISDLAFGCYSVTVTDENGCEASTQACVENENAPQIAFEVTNPSCNLDNGVITAHITGGVEPYSLSWTGSVSGDTSISDLAEGVYYLLVIDDNGCESLDSVSLTNTGVPVITGDITEPACGLTNGAIDVTVSGGASPYDFSWSPNGETTEDLVDLAPGDYNLTVTDDAGCEIAGLFTLVNGNGPQISSTQVNALCGSDNGSIDLTVSGGSGDYNYAWTGDDGFTATSEDISSLVAGDYSIVITDNVSGCQDSTTITITNSNSFTTQTTVTPATCGQSTGSIDLTVTGSSSNYTYSWSDGALYTATTQDISDIPAGDYEVIITDTDNNCIDSVTVSVTNSNSFTVEADITDATCNLNNGAIDITITGGTEPFTYLWCNGQTVEDASNLAAGTCSVTITDGSGCEVTESYTINSIPGLTVSGNTVDATCGLCNGSVTLQLLNAAQPVTILWSNGASAETITDLCADDYSVTVTDANGCIALYSTTISTTLPPVLSTTTVSSQCGQSIGSIDLTVTGGTGSMTYAWSGPSGFTASTEDISGLVSGDYTVIVTDGLNCSATTTVTITNTDDPILSFAVTNASCGSSTGSIDLTVSQSAGPFTYSWTGPASFTASTEDITAIPVGTYTVTVTAGACSVTADTSIINTDAPTATLVLSDDTICSGSSIQLNIDITGTGPFTFVYSDGNVSTTETLSSAGTFSVAVSPTTTTTYTMISLIADADPSCPGNFPVGTATVVVNPTPAQPIITASGPLSFCEGGNVVLTSSSQTNNTWSLVGPDQFNQSITVTESGSYTVAVSNSFGCADTSDAIVVDVLPIPATFAGNDTTVCSGSVIQLQGTGADSYLWSPSIYLSGTIISNPVCIPLDTTTYILTGTNSCGVSSDTIVINVIPVVNSSLGPDQLVCPGSTVTLSVEDIPGATYAWEPSALFGGSSTSSSVSFVANAAVSVSVSTTNTNGCSATDTVQIDLSTAPAAPIITAQGPTTFCEGDSLVLTSSTGNFVIWSNGLENFDEILVTESGSYFVTLVNGNCPATSDTIVVTVIPKPEAVINFSGNTTVCEGTCIDLSTTSSSSGIQWTNPDGSTSTGPSTTACDDGTYLLTITENGCSASDSVNVTVVPQPVAPIIILDGPAVVCANEFTTLTSSYATGNQWFLGPDPIAGATGNSISVSEAGSYTVVYTNTLGCISTSAAQVIIVKPLSPLAITASSDTVLCGNNPESVDLLASGGFITYTWNTTETTQGITINSANTYTVTGINQDGCESQASITFINAPAFDLTLTSPVYFDNYNVTIKGESDGSIDLSVNPSGNYAYSWSSGQTTEDLSNIPAGTYTVTVTDEFGCPQTGSIEVKEPDDIKLPNGFTPNGDGYNDFYVIKGIQGFTECQVDIFNRWGNLVYSKKGYTNDWNGLSNDGNELPDGTYFIVVDLNKEGKENVKSSIDLRRK